MNKYKVLDLFSGCGGMSYGFFKHSNFEVVGAVDAEIGKPSSKNTSIECNKTYEENLKIKPHKLNLLVEDYKKILEIMNIQNIDILISCAPCTGFSRMNNKNHIIDDPRNNLVGKSWDFIERLKPKIFIMENARELINGRFNYHYKYLESKLLENNYKIKSSIEMLSNFGLPQRRERSIIIATINENIYDLNDLWNDLYLENSAKTVGHALGILEKQNIKLDINNEFPKLGKTNMERISMIPLNGGSWIDLYKLGFHNQLTPSMQRLSKIGKFGSHPDVYGRMSLEKPAPTIKRECAHIGNGRYSHPLENRLCTVRELATLQGFPFDYIFRGNLSNKYRQIGDAVPPMISYQIANVCDWILSGRKPKKEEIVLEKTVLSHDNIKINTNKNNQLDLFT